jgi:predicted amidohydrolase YtcJ
MQPIHCTSDMAGIERWWGARGAGAYVFRRLGRRGAVVAFGSDAPVDDASPLAGIDAATSWRRRARWHPELSVSLRAALNAYTRGAAYAVGMEDELGALTPGRLCDLTVVENGRVIATVVGGRVSWRTRSRRTPRKASPRSARGAH